MRNIRNMKKQQGLALFMSLMMLLLMTVIIVHAARSSSLDILIGNNAQHAAQALMRAEDSVIAAEDLIETVYDGAPNVDFSAIPSDGLLSTRLSLLGSSHRQCRDSSDRRFARVTVARD